MEKWIPVEVQGDFPHPSGLIQRVDDESFAAICNQKLPPEGLPLDFDHYGELTDGERLAIRDMGINLPTKAGGWMKEFAVKLVNGAKKLFARTELTPDGEKAIADKSYLRTSPVHPRSMLKSLGNGIVHILGISGCALTNKPNIEAIGAILNARPDLANADTASTPLFGQSQPIEDMANSETQPIGENMESIAKALNCEPTEEAILAAIASLKGAGEEMKNAQTAADEARKVELAALTNRAETAEADAAKVKGEMEAVQKKITEDAMNARVAAELAKYPTLANRAEAEAVLRLDFDKGAALLAVMPNALVNGKSPEDLEQTKLTLAEYCARGTRK